jgi:glycosyltransferase involved in cell wall biosynthesis
MKIFYWSPFLSNIATVDAVTKSINSILTYDKYKKFKPYIVDATGEWDLKKHKVFNINIIKLYNKNYFKNLPKGGYLKSRISQTLIFLLNFIKLKKLIKNEKPDFFIAHLIISLPLLIFTLFNLKSKLIIRISGTPKLNFIRKFVWSICSRSVHKVTCPTITTYNKLINLRVFPKEKIIILHDPIISARDIVKKKREPMDIKFRDNNYLIGVGRLTKQKNFKILIKAFNEIVRKDTSTKLLILGEGEQMPKLNELIIKLNLEKKVHLLGYQKNVFNYINNAKCLISSSLYEDPGFVIIEAGFLNKFVLAADSKTGPSEILNNSTRGILFKNDDYKDLAEKYIEFTNLSNKELNKKIINLKKYSRQFTLYNHFKNLKNILAN